MMRCPTCNGSTLRPERPEVGSPLVVCYDCLGTGKVPYPSRSPSDGFCASRVTFYAALYPVLRQRAYELGYALALHGTLTKDLDVLAAPWTEAAVSADDLAAALVEAAGGFTSSPPSNKPHGRKAWTIYLGSSGGYVDLSVMPRGGE